MSLPANFSSSPNEHPQSYFYNLIIDFKKTVQKSKNITELTSQMDRLLNASKEMKWIIKNTGVYHKHDGPKAMEKVFTEFERYIDSIRNNDEADPVDLLDSLKTLQKVIEEDQIL